MCLQDSHESEKDPPEWKVLPPLLKFFTWTSSVHPQDSVNMPWRKSYLRQVSNNVWLNDKVIITYPTIIKWHVGKNILKKINKYITITSFSQLKVELTLQLENWTKYMKQILDLVHQAAQR